LFISSSAKTKIYIPASPIIFSVALKNTHQAKGGHFTKSFVAENILFSEEHPDKSSALRREAQIKGWTRKKKLALVKGDAELLKKL